ncbi:Fis family transcriptional regulator [Siphonobacter sp. BAB-5385]|uniref:sigma 54-interacting transcriptional regulator n=1 Tax=Siphonobacter sp. BAB-5385 TaxID=1864822 RepID=UPI000B9E9CFC|nr:sigma-54 dependent transcriptional regulator [Siphonobacter sp. BAB-5385]OZI07011.1 Fis family transcriptional regulator [Siphonobacter sp. BAB-5385]
MKTLISWLAFNNDFKPDTPGVNKEGPTFQFHQHFYKTYDRHVLLSSGNERKEDLKLTHLLNEIMRNFPNHRVEPRYLSISDVIDVNEIRSKIERLLLEMRGDEIDIFISPGTPAMQMAWYLCHISLGLRTRLLQTRSLRYSKSSIPELIEVKIEQSSVPVSAILSEERKSDSTSSYAITESLQPLYKQAQLAAQADRVTCLIRGEHGTGKEHLARYIHDQSARRKESFVSINCSALGDTLLESRLFGYKKGAFTGADKDTKGLLETAHGGTVFLDEIGDVSLYMQQSLLRVLQNGEILPVGATKPVQIDIRIIAATNKPLEQMAEREQFRWDLYYRLSVVELHLPRVKDRNQKEVEELLTLFSKQIPLEMRREKPLTLSTEAKKAILNYSFPGNVRELENLIRQLCVFYTEEVQLRDLPPKIQSPKRSSTEPEGFNWADHEKALIQRAFVHFKGVQRQMCQALGYGSINTLRKKIEEYGIK